MQVNDGLTQGLGEYSSVDISKFRQFVKEAFKGYVKPNFDHLDFIKSTARFYSIELPPNISEFLIKMDSAPLFWISDIPFLLKTEEYFDNLNKSSGKNSRFSELKKLYSKWVFLKSERDKQFYTLSAINLLEKDLDKNHILKKILHAILLSFNVPMISLDKAIQLLDEAEQLTEFQEGLDEKYISELKYYINLYKGIIYLKAGDFYKSITQFEDTILLKNNGISATYFNAIAYLKSGDFEAASAQIVHLIEFDKERFTFAIKYRSVNLLDFFVKNAIIYNIFSEDEFSVMFEQLEQIINFNYEYDTRSLKQILVNLDTLENLKLSEHYTDQIAMNIEFLKKACSLYKENQNKVISNISYLISKFFNSTLELILKNAEDKYEKNIDEKVKIFDIQIKESKKRIELTQSEIEKGTKEIEKRLEVSLSSVEHELEQLVGNVEFKLEHIDENSKFNPSETFKNSMIYNGIISMVVFIITGFSGGFLNNINNYNNFGLVLTATIFAGFKWGLLTYIVGTLVSLVSSASTMWERTTQKNRLVKQIAYLKNVGERNRKQLKLEAEKQIAFHSKKMNEKIENLKEEISEFEKDKEMHRNELKQEIINEVIAIRQKLQNLFI